MDRHPTSPVDKCCNLCVYCLRLALHFLSFSPCRQFVSRSQLTASLYLEQRPAAQWCCFLETLWVLLPFSNNMKRQCIYDFLMFDLTTNVSHGFLIFDSPLICRPNDGSKGSQPSWTTQRQCRCVLQGVFTVTNNHSLIVSQLKAGVINVRDGSETKDLWRADVDDGE